MWYGFGTDKPNSTKPVESVDVIAQTREMWDLTVADAHTFFVGDGQTLVHNVCDNVLELDVPPGREGIQVAYLVPPEEMVILSNKFGGIEFKLQEVRPGIFQRGQTQVIEPKTTQYWLYSGVADLVKSPSGPNRVPIYHTHPSGKPMPSSFDRKVIEDIQVKYGKYQQAWYGKVVDRSALIPVQGPASGQVFYYGKTPQPWENWHEAYDEWVIWYNSR